VPKNKVTERIDPFALPEPWRDAVVEALRAQVRYNEAVQRTPAGAVRTRLETIGERIDDGVQECWQIARRGAQLVEARQAINATDAQEALEKASLDADQSWAVGSDVERRKQALQAQVETAARLDRVIAESKSHLLVLDARLDEAVARTIELSVQVDDADALGGLGADVDGLVSEMEALRSALEETTQVSQRATGSG
jgi:hypothetical protein